MGAQPPNFSWVLPGRLAGLALPRLPAHYRFLREQGVRHLVSLTERGPPHSDSCPGLTLHRLRIPDFCPPAPEQIDRFVRIVDEASARGENPVVAPRSAGWTSGLSHARWLLHWEAQGQGCGGWGSPAPEPATGEVIGGLHAARRWECTVPWALAARAPCWPATW
ncbi:dual specificity protein phosphatase 23 isoform X1 [Vulpes lagopus]|uniref:dual specificity protein phosphatase 23 isoform X1 n=1 Tax=Vulpes lagopus TaxID=494514 RepID=UPI001BCA16A7|nr:dual specificity protein phosphatase 23 isoform X1 [Vulpes lagopus]